MIPKKKKGQPQTQHPDVYLPRTLPDDLSGDALEKWKAAERKRKSRHTKQVSQYKEVYVVHNISPIFLL